MRDSGVASQLVSLMQPWEGIFTVCWPGIGTFQTHSVVTSGEVKSKPS
jgi:hypothetical protein